MQHIAHAHPVLVTEDMVTLRSPGGDIQRVGGIRLEVVRARDVGCRSIRQREVAGELNANRIEAAGGDNVAGKGGANRARRVSAWFRWFAGTLLVVAVVSAWQ